MSFFQGETVLVTGHTGFKGSWLCKVLCELGAEVVGYALPPFTTPNLFELSGIEGQVTSYIGDVRDLPKLMEVFQKYRPKFVFHLAAQPIVRESYANPAYTYEVNVMGTVNVLECVRKTESVKSFVNVTTDKVYFNADLPNHAFKETDLLDGYDPYSNSKSCSELVTNAYRRSFFGERACAISTARAGNVLGGGDFSKDRLMADVLKALIHREELVIRNPHSTRPYQHVLDALYGYLLLAKEQLSNSSLAGSYNIGPNNEGYKSNEELIKLFASLWGNGFSYSIKPDFGPHEAAFLELDCEKMKNIFNWAPRWTVSECLKMCVEWDRAFLSDPSSIPLEMVKEIASFGFDL